MRRIVTIVATIISIFVIVFSTQAHPGGKDANGCHIDNSSGQRHGHPANKVCGDINLSREEKLRDRPKIYNSCQAVRDAGANPIRRGDRGYGVHLDRDKDGIGCECGTKGQKSLIDDPKEEGCPGPSATS